MLSQLCHQNLPWLHGINNGNVKIIVSSCILFHGTAVNLFEAMYTKGEISINLTTDCFKKILTGVACALVYLFNHQFLHNDIKADNVMIKSNSMSDGTIGVLID